MKKLDITDIHNTLHTGWVKYTFTGTRSRSRLDRIYMNDNIKQKVTKYKIILNHYSDHDGIKIEMTWGKKIKWGKGWWKLNTVLLQD